MILNGSNCIAAILCLSNVALRGRADTAAAVIIHTQKQFFWNLLI